MSKKILFLMNYLNVLNSVKKEEDDSQQREVRNLYLEEQQNTSNRSFLENIETYLSNCKKNINLNLIDRDEGLLRRVKNETLNLINKNIDEIIKYNASTLEKIEKEKNKKNLITSQTDYSIKNNKEEIKETKDFLDVFIKIIQSKKKLLKLEDLTDLDVHELRNSLEKIIELNDHDIQVKVKKFDNKIKNLKEYNNRNNIKNTKNKKIKKIEQREIRQGDSILSERLIFPKIKMENEYPIVEDPSKDSMLDIMGNNSFKAPSNITINPIKNKPVENPIIKKASSNMVNKSIKIENIEVSREEKKDNFISLTTKNNEDTYINLGFKKIKSTVEPIDEDAVLNYFNDMLSPHEKLEIEINNINNNKNMVNIIKKENSKIDDKELSKKIDDFDKKKKIKIEAIPQKDLGYFTKVESTVEPIDEDEVLKIFNEIPDKDISIQEKLKKKIQDKRKLIKKKEKQEIYIIESDSDSLEKAYSEISFGNNPEVLFANSEKNKYFIPKENEDDSSEELINVPLLPQYQKK